jgi:hypothetical protein
MAQEVKAYRANDGTLHEDICAAATRDVELLVQGSPLYENQPYARQLVEWLCDYADAIRETLAAHALACPRDGEAAVQPKPHPLGDLQNRKSAAIGHMQRLGAPARDWLTRNGFRDLKHFTDQATEVEVEAYEHWTEEPAAFQTTSEHNELVANKD